MGNKKTHERILYPVEPEKKKNWIPPLFDSWKPLLQLILLS